MIRIGILGAAKIAPKALIPQVKRRADCTILAVAARDAIKARAYADAHGIPEVVESYEALIARPDIDLIYNALPPNRHADLSIAALKAGKHVLCEKPFAMNAGEARAMADAAQRSGRHLIEAFHYRFHPMFEDILEKVRSGAIGKLCAMKAEFSVRIPYSPEELRHRPDLGGGALMDLGCYPLHWLRTIAGSEPRLVSARMEEGTPGVDLVTEAVLEFPGGIPARLRTSMKPGQPYKALIALKGSDAILRAVNPIHPTFGNSISFQRGRKVTRYTVDGETTYDYQLAHVIDVITGRAAPLTGGTDAVANMTMIDAIYEAGGLKPRGT
ncbi:oxidoreductase, NAD-binding [Hyphomonas neptunium ATCC 15444]|uniref:Oxidoreductase, NAD-binding n=2 Tax=Hyphomonas TaxID=85 RepID=Q0C404_HYPNA|nr:MULTISPECIES: Gfo/Idh/MocA family oxidoreductase [Hyphomonas]ABI76350.1 oxidoreductase, NAD-binding [Hyphomonas neptunium ATCC 15444]KCZ96248.1 NAD-binding oxidoreductase [Hyphomonas hirschiana VP5]